MNKYDFNFQVMLSTNHEWVNGYIVLPVYAENKVMAKAVAEHIKRTMGFDSCEQVSDEPS
jgi:hypothetical protein